MYHYHYANVDLYRRSCWEPGREHRTYTKWFTDPKITETTPTPTKQEEDFERSNELINGSSSLQIQSLTKISFLDLPREIRDLIYTLVLRSSTPLIAWAGMPLEVIAERHRYDYSYDDHPQTFVMGSYFNNALPVERMIVRLNLVSRQVSDEAMATFWSQNVFRFLGDWVWDSILDWLVSIGDINRGYLRNLELMMQEPHHVWQLPEPPGPRTQLDTGRNHRVSVEYQNARETVYPRNQHLFLELGRAHEGIVENISPAVEDVFRLLGKTAGHDMSINMLMPVGIWPSIRDVFTYEHGIYPTMDLPNVMERCRELYTAQEGKGIEVLWKCMERGPDYDLARSSFSKSGWAIVAERNTWNQAVSMIHSLVEPEMGLEKNMNYRDVWFSLRKKTIEDDITAQRPSRHSECYYFWNEW
jgi:hypothetical protein